MACARDERNGAIEQSVKNGLLTVIDGHEGGVRKEGSPRRIRVP